MLGILFVTLSNIFAIIPAQIVRHAFDLVNEGITLHNLYAGLNQQAAIYDVFARYDPENLLLHQAHREVLERQLESSRLRATLERLARSRVLLRDVRRPTPFAFPLLVDRLRDTVSSETLADRVKKMQLSLEKAACA